jgi:tryptophan 2,3-dioxygenase
MLHELGLACQLVRGDHFAPAYKAMARIGRIQSVMTLSWDVLATLTPVDYAAFRDVLGTSSGFQSVQFRELEFRLGLKEPKYLEYHEGGTVGHARLAAALAEPSLWEEANAALARAGFDLGAKGPEGYSSEAIVAAWTQVYRDSERWFELYQLAEKLVDIDDALASWRHKHVLTVTRIIGNKMGTGGSAGAAYLESTLSKRAFPELWSLRTAL